MSVGVPFIIPDGYGFSTGASTLRLINPDFGYLLPGQTLVVVLLATSVSTTTVTTVVDNSSNSLALSTAYSLVGVGYVQLAWRYYSAAPNHPYSISVTLNNASAAVYGVVYGQMGFANPTLDTTGAGTSSVGGTTPSVSTGMLGASNAAVYAALRVPSGASDGFTEASGFTSGTNVTNGSTIFRTAYGVATSSTTKTFDPVLGTARAYIGNVWAFSEPVTANLLMWFP